MKQLLVLALLAVLLNYTKAIHVDEIKAFKLEVSEADMTIAKRKFEPFEILFSNPDRSHLSDADLSRFNLVTYGKHFEPTLNKMKTKFEEITKKCNTKKCNLKSLELARDEFKEYATDLLFISMTQPDGQERENVNKALNKLRDAWLYSLAYSQKLNKK